jgi:hypothetical protein
LARSAGFAVAQKPGGTAFNPLLIYGGVGLGQDAPGPRHRHRDQKQPPGEDHPVRTREKFTQQFIEAVKNNTMGDFQQFYQMMDVLIIDDVQFLAGKEKTQDVFFHIFNHLHQSGKQLVITSDKAPVEMQRHGATVAVPLQVGPQRRPAIAWSGNAHRHPAEEDVRRRASTCRKTWWNTSPTASPPTSANWKAP